MAAACRAADRSFAAVRSGQRPRHAGHLHRHSVLGGERDVAEHDGVGVGSQRSQSDGGHGHPEHLDHLGLRQGRTDATADPATKGQPGVRLGLLVDKPLWAELVRLGVEILSQVNEGNSGVHLDAGGKRPPGDGPRLGQGSLGSVDDRTQPEGLFGYGVEIGVASVLVDLVPQSVEHRRVAQQQLERERQGCRSRLVPRAEHREQLVTQLNVGHRAAVLVARAHQQGEDVGPLLQVGLFPAARDLLVEKRVGGV